MFDCNQICISNLKVKMSLFSLSVFDIVLTNSPLIMLKASKKNHVPPLKACIAPLKVRPENLVRLVSTIFQYNCAKNGKGLKIGTKEADTT